MSGQKNLEETRDEFLRVFGDKCPDLNNILDKTTCGDKAIKAACIVCITKLKEKDTAPFIVALAKASQRISELEQTLSTYEMALKSEGKVPGQLEFDFMKEDA